MLDCEDVLEIGTGFGYSATWLALGLSSCTNPGRIWTVDNWSEGGAGKVAPAVAAELWQRVALNHLIEQIEGQSPTAVLALPVQASLAFIDGSHYGDQPIRDMMAVIEKLTERGCIVMHDAQPKYGVLAAVRAAAEFGFIAEPLDTSCQPILLARSEAVIAASKRALSLAVESRWIGDL